MKEKQIEDMAKDMCEYYYEGTCYQDKKPCDCKCEIFTDAQYLYAKGYRKAADVAREIIDDVKETLLDYHLQENKKYLNSQSKTKKQFDIETARYRAITDTVKFAIATLDELKNKYESEEGK